MFVLGIDPGLTRCGYGFVESNQDGLRGISAGVITSSPDLPLPQRLGNLYAELRGLICQLEPTDVVVEKVFFQTNVRTAMAVGQASGIALAVAAQANLPVVQYTSNEVKQSLTGYGAASKMQIQQMVQRTLGLKDVPHPPDVADALALAICHLTIAPRMHRYTNAKHQVGARS